MRTISHKTPLIAWVLELGFSLGFGVWNLGFPVDHAAQPLKPREPLNSTAVEGEGETSRKTFERSAPLNQVGLKTACFSLAPVFGGEGTGEGASCV